MAGSLPARFAASWRVAAPSGRSDDLGVDGADRDFRWSLGLAPVSPWGDPFHRGQHARDGVLAMYSPLLGTLPSDVPPHTTLTGWCRYTPDTGAIDEALLAFLAAGAAPIVFTLGSAAVHAGEAFLGESIEVARALGCRAVLLTGSPELRARFALAA